ncbi:MAG: arsenate reductase ArsC [Armatimonadota bacterium]
MCVHNSGRSQMAEAIFNHFAKGKAKAVSAGTQPGAEVNPLAIQALSEIGVPTDGLHPKMLTREMLQQSNRVITMGCGVQESCPALLHGINEDWGLDDPSGQPIEKVREIRDQIVVLVKKLLQELEGT